MGSSNTTTIRTTTGSTRTANKRQRQNDDDEEASECSNSSAKSRRSKSKSISDNNCNSRTNRANSHAASESLPSKKQNSVTESESKSNSSSLPSVLELQGEKSVFAAMVGRVVKNTIFPKKQFIILERELDSTSKVAESCIKEMKIDRSKWYSVKNLVRTRLNRVRNNAQLSVRKKLYSKFVVLCYRFVTSMDYLTCARVTVLQDIYQSME